LTQISFFRDFVQIALLKSFWKLVLGFVVGHNSLELEETWNGRNLSSLIQKPLITMQYSPHQPHFHPFSHFLQSEDKVLRLSFVKVVRNVELKETPGIVLRSHFYQWLMDLFA
jgi:hypothetical protein